MSKELSSPSESQPYKYFEDQFDDESVELVFRKHPIVMRKGLIFASIVLLLGTLPGLITLDNKYMVLGLIGGFLLSIVSMIPSWIKWYFSVFIVTDQRFIQIRQKGLFHKAVSDIGLNQIQSMNYAVPGFLATILGFGTIVVQTYMGDIELHTIHHPAKTQTKMQLILREKGIEPATMHDEEE